MKRSSVISIGLLVVTSFVFGCAHLPGQGRWTTIFDGTSLDNWYTVGGGNWRLEDGAVQADKSTTKGSSFLVSKNSYKDFEIRVEFWVDDKANSGIYFRCSDVKNITDRTCYEANVFDQRSDPSFGTGALQHIGPVATRPKAGGKWNVYEVRAQGPELTVVLNGEVTAYARDTQFASGPIALQYGSGVVKIRKVQVRPL